MASFVVETFVPTGNRERFASDVDGLRRVAASAADGQVRYVRSYLVPGDEMAYHLVEAGSATDVELVTRRAGIEPERIVEAVRVDGITGPNALTNQSQDREGVP